MVLLYCICYLRSVLCNPPGLTTYWSIDILSQEQCLMFHKHCPLWTPTSTDYNRNGLPNKYIYLSYKPLFVYLTSVHSSSANNREPLGQPFSAFWQFSEHPLERQGCGLNTPGSLLNLIPIIREQLRRIQSLIICKTKTCQLKISTVASGTGEDHRRFLFC